MKNLWYIDYRSFVDEYSVDEQFLVWADDRNNAEDIAKNHIEFWETSIYDEEIPEYLIRYIEIFDDSIHGPIHNFEVF